MKCLTDKRDIITFKKNPHTNTFSVVVNTYIYCLLHHFILFHFLIQLTKKKNTVDL